MNPTTEHDPTLHLLCGRIAAGKSTLAHQLATHAASIVLSEDQWLARLYPDEIHTLDDYVHRAGLLRQAIAPLVIELLARRLSVVLDFPANTVQQRRWMRRLVEDSGAAHKLHFLDLPVAVCKARLRLRNASGEHPYQVAEAQFEAINRYFQAPSVDEGFTIVRQPSD